MEKKRMLDTSVPLGMVLLHLNTHPDLVCELNDETFEQLVERYPKSMKEICEKALNNTKDKVIKVPRWKEPIPLYQEDLQNEFIKYDEGKLRWDLLPKEGVEPIIEVLMHGARKYDDHNWRNTNSMMRYWNAAIRHLWAWRDGETHDLESGINHLAHAACCIVFLLALRDEEDKDDRRAFPRDGNSLD